MTKVYNAVKGYPPTFLQAVIEIDIDPAAERVVILGRILFNIIYNIRKPVGNLLRVVVPFEYAIKNDLLVGILDEDAVYNCAFSDGVQAQIVDGLIVKNKK